MINTVSGVELIKKRSSQEHGFTGCKRNFMDKIPKGSEE